MKLTFNQFGKSLVLIVDGKKTVATISSKEERDAKVSEIKKLIEKFKRSNSDRTHTKIANSIKKILIPEGEEDIKENKKAQKNKLVKQISDITGKLKKNLDKDLFVVKEGDVYLKGFEEVVMPAMLVEEFITYKRKKRAIDPLINFWYKCLLNPNPVARTKLFDYLQRHRIIITPHGNFVTYRMVKDNENGKQLPEGTFTHAHSVLNKKDRFYYKIGEVARMNRKDCDEDGKRDCSRGLHTGSPDFIGISLGDGYNKGEVKVKSQGGGYGTGYDHPKETTQQFNHTFGNVAVICIVDPQHVVSIPDSDTRKMRSCELYFAKKTTPEEVLKHLKDEDYHIYDSEYAAIQQEELKKLVKSKKLTDYLDGKELTSKRIDNLRKKLKNFKMNNDGVNKELDTIQLREIIQKRMVKV